jgi:glycosyltransferase involved in cell wall biosynthesis
MRLGSNPAKTGVPAYSPRQLGVALLTYIPNQAGYFANALQIFKIQLESLYKTTLQDFDLLVFDNGSCPPVVRALQELHAGGRIDWLVLSRHNMGKAGAWNWIFSAMPNELICYADSDVLFRPGWLESSLHILKAFPNPGMVSAQPNFFDVLDGQGKAHLILKEDPKFELGSYLPEKEIIDEYCSGLGANEQLSERFHSAPIPYVVNKAQEITAVIGATHMQFLTTREVARQVVPLPVSKGLYRGETIGLDRKVDVLGYLHLSTQENFVIHMGNTITERLSKEISEIVGNQVGTKEAPKRVAARRSLIYRLASRLARNDSIKRFFLRAYNFLFRVLYTETPEGDGN